jgi:aromatic ring-opening dioxygenase LigB subunit
MTLTYACIAPHGSDVIPELANKRTLRSFEETRKGMLSVAREVKRARPDTIIIASPHNLRVHQHIGIVTAENSSGTLRGWNAPEKRASMKVKCNTVLAKELLAAATRRRLPVVGVNYGTFEGSNSDMAMDWGTFVPLWFFMHQNRIKPKVVIVTPSREIPLEQNIAFGRTIADTAERKRERIVFVASADQAHAHKKNGPYGFNKAADEYDKFMVKAIETDDIDSIRSLSPKFVEAAKPDSLWQIAMLAGVSERVPLCPRLYSYQVPTYFGMICAGYQRDSE